MNAVESSCRPHCTSGRRNLRFYYNHYTEKYYKNVKILHTELLRFLNIYDLHFLKICGNKLNTFKIISVGRFKQFAWTCIHPTFLL